MKKKKSSEKPDSEANNQEEWDPREGYGILPDDISFTQNIGCVGGKEPKKEKPNTKDKT